MSVVVWLSVWVALVMAVLWMGRRVRSFRDYMDAEHGSGWAQ